MKNLLLMIETLIFLTTKLHKISAKISFVRTGHSAVCLFMIGFKIIHHEGRTAKYDKQAGMLQ